jgi:predicted DNA binding CopG/RHH family protein
MAQKRSASSAPAGRAAKSAKNMRDRRIGFSDKKESTKAELKRARHVRRSKLGDAELLIDVRIPSRLFVQVLRMAAKQSKTYQTLIRELLEKAARRAG